MMCRASVVLCLICLCGCTRSNPPLTAALQGLAGSQDPAIMFLVQGGSAEAIAPSGKIVGTMTMPGGQQEMSLDGTCLAWLPISSNPVYLGGTGEPTAFVMDAPGATRQVRINAAGASMISPSARCAHLALRVEDSNLRGQLIVIDSDTSGREVDLTALLTAFGLQKAQRIPAFVRRN